ncbi:MAG: NHLP bacteriocin export ABC transporter permease/ATPase subunit [Eubacterium sp.]|nr:NHLP bacteriocin export ABC transporter permease/ATPase subunit [Eubacterium sp.]
MSWFDEQIRERKEADMTEIEETFRQMASAVKSGRMSDALNDDRQGAASAIGEILNYYHVKAREVPEELQDLNDVLEYLLRPCGIMRRTVHLERGWYHDAAGPMLGRRISDGSVVALMPHRLSGYRFFDQKKKKYVRVNRKNQDEIEPEAFAFYKSFPPRRMSLKDLVKYIVMQVSAGDVILLVMMLLLVTGVGMITPHLTSMLYSDVLKSGSRQGLIGIGIFMISVTVTAMLFKAASSLASGRISTKLSLSVEAATMMRVLSLPADFFKKYSVGELTNRVECMNSLSDQIVSMVLSTGLSSLFSLVYVFQIFYFTPSLVEPALIVILVTVLVSAFTMILQIRVSRKQMEHEAKESGISYSMISGIQKIRLAGAETRAFARWGKVFAEGARLTANPPFIVRIGGALSAGVSLVGTTVIYFMAVDTQVAVSEYFAFNSLYGMVSGAFIALAGIATQIASVKPTLEMVEPIMSAEPEIDEGKTVITSLMGGIELSHVTFRYREDMPAVLEDFSLKIRPGQYIAVVGQTGCGKSTLMRILLGFEKPQKGAVYYDGKDLNSIDPKSLRRQVGSVMQDGKVFMGDIYSNIVISAPWLTLDEAWEAAELAGLAEDIRSMPMGMNTMITEGSGGISGGQRQRLMIARAVAPKPRILMFDEATSALDNITQKHVSEALDSMKCTRIVIAHRLSTIRQCDRIVVLDGGHIVEDGTYEELIARNGSFAELVERQRLGE